MRPQQLPQQGGTVQRAAARRPLLLPARTARHGSLRLKRAAQAAALPQSGATRDVKFAYTKDIQTKLKPGVFAERQDNRAARVASAADWQTVVALFYELGQDGSGALVCDMLVALQRLVPQAAPGSTSSRLSAEEAAVLATALTRMCQALLDSVARLGIKGVTNAVWALALLPDPAKVLKTPAAAAARARTVAALGAAVISRLPRLRAEDAFHVCAGLALLGFVPPATLTPEPRAGEAAPTQRATTFGALLEQRSIKVLPFLAAKGVADAGFVAARLVPRGGLSAAWLAEYAAVVKQHLAAMQPEALVHAGYTLARHGLLPSNSWRKAFLAALQQAASVLSGEEFPMALFTLARWQQHEAQQQQQQPPLLPAWDEDEERGGGAAASYDAGFDDGADSMFGPAGPAAGGASGGPNPATVPSQALLDELLLASFSNRALRELPLSQLVAMLRSLAQLQASLGSAGAGPGISINAMWLKRLWPAVNAKLDAASAGGGGAPDLAPDLAALLAVLPALQPRPELPADFLEGVAGNLGLGLTALAPRELAAAWAALRQLQHAPDAIFLRQLQHALLAALPGAAAAELPQLLQLALEVGAAAPAAAGEPSAAAGGSEDGSSAAEFNAQLLEALTADVAQRVSAVAGVSRARAQPQPQQQQQQQLLDAAAAQGLWELPQALQALLQQLAAAAAAQQSAACSAALRDAMPELQRLWQRAAVQLAPAMPTEALLVLLGAIVDLQAHDAAIVGLAPGEQQQQQDAAAGEQQRTQQDVVRAVVEAAVVAALPSPGDAGAASARGRTGRAAAAPPSPFVASFAVADCSELITILLDAGLQPQPQLLQAAEEVLHGATAPKVPAWGWACTPEQGDELVELLAECGHKLTPRTRARFNKWRWPAGVPRKARKAAAAAP